jgi:hypothetical protein
MANDGTVLSGVHASSRAPARPRTGSYLTALPSPGVAGGGAQEVIPKSNKDHLYKLRKIADNQSQRSFAYAIIELY